MKAFCRAFEGRRDVRLIIKNVAHRDAQGKIVTEAWALDEREDLLQIIKGTAKPPPEVARVREAVPD